MKRLVDKIAVVTGTSGGIGMAITKRYLEEGVKVVAVDISREGLQKLADTIGTNENLFPVQTDITSEESTRNLYEQVLGKWNRLDIIVNNAGWYSIVSFEKMTFSDWRQVMGVNLDGAFLVTKSLLPLLKQSADGRVINVSSGTFFSPVPSQTHYISAKAGILGFTRALAIELGALNIKVNAITPGLVTTQALKNNLGDEFIEFIAGQTKCGRADLRHNF